ncbi:MAG: hypothetical protein AAF533_28725, partial [Acidobacteriota bacterium]
RPFYELGRNHAPLGNWGCAADALELSELTEDFGSDTVARLTRQDLLRGVRNRREAGDAEDDRP